MRPYLRQNVAMWKILRLISVRHTQRPSQIEADVNKLMDRRDYQPEREVSDCKTTSAMASRVKLITISLG